MVVVLNGSFGVGKTTVAGLLRRSLPRSVVYDPEWAGFVIRRAPGWLRLRGAGTDDFQDVALWRRSAVVGARFFRLCASGAVIVPMTFTHRAYFDEVVSGVERFDAELRVFCLRASLETVRSRIVVRGDAVEGPGSEWIARRIVECAEAHRDPHFGEPVETEDRSAREVADEILTRLGR